MTRFNDVFVVISTFLFLSISLNTYATRCENVPELLVNLLEQELTVVRGSLVTNTAQMVRSKDFQNIYFVAAEIQGQKKEGKGDIGLWATNSVEAGKGMILSINSEALKSSPWPNGKKSPLKLSKKSDGARKAISCVKKASVF